MGKFKKQMVALALAGSLLSALWGSAGAVANSNANCVGRQASTLNGHEPGLGGEFVSGLAREEGGVGQFASNNKCPRH